MQAPQVPAWIFLKSKEDPSHGFRRTTESGPSVRRYQETLLSDGFHLEQEHPVICSSVTRTASSCVINAPPTTAVHWSGCSLHKETEEEKLKRKVLFFTNCEIHHIKKQKLCVLNRTHPPLFFWSVTNGTIDND